MILEGIVTTLAPEGDVNIAPMGPIVNADMSRLILRPFNTSRTYQNLKSHPEGVFHVTDDVLLLAQAAVGRIEPAPDVERATAVLGIVLSNACRFYEFRVNAIDDERERVTMEAEVVYDERRRDFFGFNRAKHAVVEAAILATRVAFLPADEIEAEFRRLEPLITKTGGPREREAFTFLHDHVEAERQKRGLLS